jgi:hypothetical protein
MNESMRWQDYSLTTGSALVDFWRQGAGAVERNILYILGRGFDPRMCLGLDELLQAGTSTRCDVLALEFHEGASSPSRIHAELVEQNWHHLQQLLGRTHQLSTRPIDMWSPDGGRRIGARSAAQVLASATELRQYTDVIIDISAMPRGVYIPLVAKALYLLDSDDSQASPNLHLFVAENPVLDARITDEGVEETASYIYPFSGGLELEATASHPKLWIALLGEGQGPQLERVYDLVVPDEICPVLPSPSLNPRRADDLVLEHRYLLFDRLRVEPTNFIYAAESNPFEVYRQIRRTIFQYKEALTPLGDCKVALSALSTKLMSVGALLVAYELKEAGIDIAVAHVESQGYQMHSSDDGVPRSQVFDIWLSGECYAP